MNRPETNGRSEQSPDGQKDGFKHQVMQLRKGLEAAYGDRQLALRIYERLVREAYGQADREQFILGELAFETNVVKAGGFWQLSSIQAGDITQQPALWEARAIRKRY